MRVEDRPEYRPHSELDKLTEFLRQEHTDLSPLQFEENLKAQGCLARLEQGGILPSEADPQARESALRLLYLGAVLANLKPNLLISPILMFSAYDVDARDLTSPS